MRENLKASLTCAAGSIILDVLRRIRPAAGEAKEKEMSLPSFRGSICLDGKWRQADSEAEIQK